MEAGNGQFQLWSMRRIEFCASRCLWNSEWTRQANQAYFGKRVTPLGYGNNFTLFVGVTGAVDPITGMNINTVELKHKIEKILDNFDHRHLNLETNYFQKTVPTTEQIACLLEELLSPTLPPSVNLAQIELWEHRNRCANVNVIDNSITSSQYCHFSAAHHTVSPHFSIRENQERFGKCINTHGHNYRLGVTVGCENKPGIGWTTDDMKIDKVIKQVMTEFDHKNLNDLSYFDGIAVTTENIVRVLWNVFGRLFQETQITHPLKRLELMETLDFRIATEGDGEFKFIREYEFSATHRMFSDQMTDEENRCIYGKCYTPSFGHGHNYKLEVTLTSELDELWGTAVNLMTTDDIIKDMIETLEMKRLDQEVSYFRKHSATSENVLCYIWQKLYPYLNQTLESVKIMGNE